MNDLATLFVDFGNSNPFIPLAFVVGISAYSVVRYYTSPWRKVPPGPRGWPIIGNALELLGCDCVREVCITIYIRDGEKMVA